MKGHFRKRGSKWSFAISLGVDPETGKRKQITKSGFKTKKEAEAACAEMITKYENGDLTISKKQSLGSYLEFWLENYAKNKLRSSTYANHEIAVNSRIKPVLGAVDLDKLTPIKVTKYLSDLQKENLSADYIKYLHSVLKKALNQAVKWQLISKNVMDNVDPPRLEQKEIVTWSPEQANEFLDYARKDKYFIAFVLAIYTGMRRGEILGLRWKDVDFEQAKISIQQTLYRPAKQGITFQEPKTKSAKRRISIPNFVIDELKAHKVRQNKNKLQYGEGYQDFDLIVAYDDGRPQDPRNLLRHYERLIKGCELPPIRFHDLRHTHATMLLQLGEHPKVVSERLGHSRVGITMDVYSHVMPDMQKDAADNFEKMMKQKQPKRL
ncbi:site-specific integrase [Brevibacillus laterosporus]|uniref:site-specific integrase n=1 Tax=Brevibacillus laterosporus TaxID=1465 RepID=UPI00264EF498|nr:site-specific integrase [Brevibacillus laterosporus]MDN9011061.1 site-specific integrase [Brevibacillus laterosporus]MDO0942084.1 site-specific integrase [Brevibacillus laterosporus]